MKRIITISLCGVLSLFLINRAVAQNITVKGTVTDATTGETLIGVSIAVPSTQTGAQTGPDGTFTISAPPNGQLQVSYIGYTTQTIAINNRATIDIKLAGQTNELQQVVVIGYGTQRKIDNTGAVAQVKGEEIAKQASINPVSALQGKVAGVQITNSGAPGASPQITIRGKGTVYGGTGLLYVVDGTWYDDVSFLNPNDIENLSILKDASSTAIYGIRASNGVVLITTKKGKKGTATVNYNGYAGWQSVTNPVEMANATEYATITNELYEQNGQAALFADPASFGTGTDWYRQVLRDAFVTNHQVSVNGGTEKSTYNFSLGYLKQDGNVKGNTYDRYTARLTNDYEPVKNLKVGFALAGSFGKSRDIPGGIFHELYSAGPVVPVFYQDGSYGDPSDFKLGNAVAFNPQVTLDFYNQRSQNYRFNGNAYAQYTFLKNFTFKTSFGGDFGENEVRNYAPVYKATLTQQRSISVLSLTRAETRDWMWENTLTYSNRFGDHNLSVLLGQTAQRKRYYALVGTGQNVPFDTDGDLYFDLADQASVRINDEGRVNTYSSYFGRINYSFKDKYLLNASLRADASSSFFNADDLYTYLPSVGAGWVVTNEEFFKEQTVFNTLKVRGSWGRVANANLPTNPTQVPVSTLPGYIAFFGPNGTPRTGANIATFSPPVIRMEFGEGTDIGIEGVMFNNRFNFEIDYYNRLTKDAIFELPILGSTGSNSGNIIGNQAEVRNNGIEFTAGWRDQAGDFKYSISGNFSINNNKVLNVTTGDNPIYAGGNGLTNGALATRTMQNRPLGEFFGYKVAGVFQTAEEVAESMQTTAKPGDFKFEDINGDGAITDKDRVPLGNPNPKYYYGFNTNFEYKNFDLALDFQGVAGVSVYNSNIAYRFGNENFTKDYFNNRWHGEGTSTTYPSANVGSTANSAPNSFFVESGAYFRVRNIQLGYTIPNSNKWGIQRIRLYANAQNAINIFNYRGFNPEIGGGPLDTGIDTNIYPMYATYNFGVNVTF